MSSAVSHLHEVAGSLHREDSARLRLHQGAFEAAAASSSLSPSHSCACSHPGRQPRRNG